MAVVVLADGRPATGPRRVQPDGAGPRRGPVGVLVDDPRCGRLLLDCGVGVAVRAAFAGISLAEVRVVPTGDGPDRLDPDVPPAAVLRPPWLPAGVRMLPAGAGEVALLVETSRGVLLHCPGPGPLPAESIGELPAWVTPTVELAPAVCDQLAGVTKLAPPATSRRVLVTGGARSGKSELAERMLSGCEHVVYLATGGVPTADDPEWSDRVARHRDRRPAEWSTVETGDAAAVLAAAASQSAVLFDCAGTWLTAAMDAAGIWTVGEAAGAGPEPVPTGPVPTGPVPTGATAIGPVPTGATARRAADAALGLAVDGLVAAWAATDATVVAVTNEVGSGVVPATTAGRRFRDELGRLNARLAAAADEVWLCTAGIGQRIR